MKMITPCTPSHFVATAVMFAVHSSLGLALILLAVIAAAALVATLLRPSRQGQTPGGLSLLVACAGVGFGKIGRAHV